MPTYSGNVSASYFIGQHLGNASLTNLSATGVIYANAGTPSTSVGTGALVVTGGVGISGNLTVGNLTVLGTQTTVNATSVAVANSFIFLSNNNITNALDIGFVGQYNAGQGNVYTGLAYHAADTIYRLFTNLTIQPSTTINVSQSRFANLQVGNLIAANIIGTIIAPSQGYITTVGNLTSLAASGNITTTGYLFGNGSQLAGIVSQNYVDGQITAANAGVTTANTGMKGYVDAISTAWQANAATQNDLIIGINANVTAANTARTTGNAGIKGYVDQQIYIVTTGYGNANTGMKGYVDSLGFYSNVQTATYLQSGNIANVSVAGNVTATYFLGNGALLTGIVTGAVGTNYSNVNVQAYTESMGFRNYSNSNVTAYTVTMGFTNFSNVNVAAYLTSQGISASGNYSNVNVKAYTETMGYQNYGNVNVAAVITTNGLTNYSNVNTAAYLSTYSGNVGNLTTKSLTVSDHTLLPGASPQIFTVDNTNIKFINYLNRNTSYAYRSGILTDTYNDGYTVVSNEYSGSNTSTLFTFNFRQLANGFQGERLGTLSFDSGIDNGPPLSTSVTMNYTPTANGSGNYGFGRDALNITNIPVVNITAGNLSVTGNITANYFTGSGAFLTALPGYAYSNVNVASYLGTGQITAANVKLAPSGNIQFADGTAQTSAYSNVNLIANLRGSVTVGNLTVLGALNTTLDIGNSFVSLATNNIGNTNDIGFYGQYSAGQGNVFTGLAYTASDGMYRLFSNLTPEPSTTITLANVRYSNIQVGGLNATGNILSTGLSVFGNTAHGLAGLVSGQFHSFIGNITQTSSGGTVYINTTGNLLVGGNVGLYGNTTHGTVGVASGAYHTFVGNITQVTSGGAVGINTTGNISASVANFGSGNIGGFAIGYRDMPQITAANLTLIAGDAGKHYYATNTSPTTLTIPLNSSVAFALGTVITVVNQGTGNITIARNTTTMYLAGNSTSADRTITSYGVGTLLKVATDTWFINGNGVV